MTKKKDENKNMERRRPKTYKGRKENTDSKERLEQECREMQTETGRGPKETTDEKETLEQERGETRTEDLRRTRRNHLRKGNVGTRT